MYFVIKGGEFNNKGAEAMSLIAIYNIHKYYPNADIYFYDTGKKLVFGNDLKVKYFKLPVWYLNYKRKNLSLFKYFFVLCKNFLKSVIKKGNYVTHKELIGGKNIIKHADVILDISGFALSSKYNINRCYEFCNWIEYINEVNPNSKIILMPQSFGPFEFDEKINKKIKNALSKCEKIYARESGGYKVLSHYFGLKDVVLSYDSVLLEKEYAAEKVISNIENYRIAYEKSQGHNVAIVPNLRLIDKGQGNLAGLLEIYSKIINNAKTETNFYLIPHAGEDIKICKMIKESFAKNDNVILIDHVMASFNYEVFIADFDYIVASRYHSIVHAYRGGTPAIIIGWSEKYDSIARAFNQEKYIYDLKGQDNILSVLSDMEENYKSERLHILEKLPDIQKYDCYEFLKHI